MYIAPGTGIQPLGSVSILKLLLLSLFCTVSRKIPLTHLILYCILFYFIPVYIAARQVETTLGDNLFDGSGKVLSLRSLFACFKKYLCPLILRRGRQPISSLSPLTLEVVGAPQMTLQQYFLSFPVFRCLQGISKPHSRQFLDVIFPSLLLSSSPSCCFHCPMQNCLRHAKGS